jgi:hypothetical protein
VTRLLSGIVSLGLLAAAMWLYGFKPHLKAGMQNPIAAKGRIGATVGNRVFSVKVDRVDVASGIVKPDILSTPAPVPSLGVFVIVYLQIRSNEKPFDPGHVHLATRGGLSYDESGRPDLATVNGDYQPMLWRKATYVFEIPKDRLAGSRLVVGQSDLMTQFSAATDVDLGIGDGAARRLLAHPSPGYVLKTA